MDVLGTIAGVTILHGADSSGAEYVTYTAGAMIDADGANGQHGKPACYQIDPATGKETGLDYLANGCMAVQNGEVVFTSDDGKDIVMAVVDGKPLMLANGVIPCGTWYQYPGTKNDDPAAYVDAASWAYVVVPPLVYKQTKGKVCGCKARVTYNGKSVDCIVADLGPSNKIGELSVAAAVALGIPSSPKNGGVDSGVAYEIWPGQMAQGFGP